MSSNVLSITNTISDEFPLIRPLDDVLKIRSVAAVIESTKSKKFAFLVDTLLLSKSLVYTGISSKNFIRNSLSISKRELLSPLLIGLIKLAVAEKRIGASASKVPFMKLYLVSSNNPLSRKIYLKDHS